MKDWLSSISSHKRGIWRYESMLPHIRPDKQITMGEGGTALVRSQHIAKELGLSSIYFKLESGNPTGSYKDRISAMGVSWALEQGKNGCIGTSSGNAGASAAAYAARAGLPYHLFVLEDIVEAKLMQAVIHEAEIIRIKGFGESAEIGEQVFAFIEQEAAKRNLEVMITAYQFNAVAMEAVKTIAFELAEDFTATGEPMPDAVFVPVGGGGLYTGIWNGFFELMEKGFIGRMPRMAAVQSDGCSNIVRAWQQGSASPLPGDSTCRISGLQVPNPPDGKEVLRALHAGDGFGIEVKDDEVWMWQEKLATQEGILCEPAAAVSLAGLHQALKEKRLQPGSSAVCILTGAGYKDNDRLRAICRSKPEIPMCEISELSGLA
ncbi:threonine synthase [Paenibacillus agricola]|uniref:Threonine synthase n=1 Tax=Paenibacillus agricola TaxID=2716264 RepID=A0ABX0JD25_9BACL|nr:threonine synthase [Paenibacillus agricola]NHN32757.1 threonine synthase [Paenibacillus agricola]